MTGEKECAITADVVCAKSSVKVKLGRVFTVCLQTSRKVRPTSCRSPARHQPGLADKDKLRPSKAAERTLNEE